MDSLAFGNVKYHLSHFYLGVQIYLTAFVFRGKALRQ